MTEEEGKKINDFLFENFNVEPAWVDEIVCEWSMKTGNTLGTDLQQEALVDRLTQILSAKLRGRFVEKRCGPPKVLGELKFSPDGTETRTGIFEE